MSSVPTAAIAAPLRPSRTAAAGLVAAAAAAAVFVRIGPSGWGVVVAATAALVVWVAAIDLETRLLPNRLIIPATVLVLAATVFLAPNGVGEHVLAALAAGGFLFVAAALRPGDLGMGDAKLALLLGALLGRTVLQALVVGFCLVAVAGLVLLARHGKPALKRHLPLGPFLAAGALAVLLLGGSS